MRKTSAQEREANRRRAVRLAAETTRALEHSRAVIHQVRNQAQLRVNRRALLALKAGKK